MNYNAWLEHFKEQLQGLTQAFESSHSPLSLLAYALKNQQLRSDDYLAWAIDYYKLPKLQSRFFTETPVSQEMFARWATHYPWSTECLPVAEWDGVLIVACLQPPQDFPSNPSFVFVLASYEDLSACWETLHKKNVTPAISPVMNIVANDEEIPEGIDMTLATSAQTKPSDSFSADELNLQEDKDSENGALEGIFSEATIVDLSALTKNVPTAEPVKVAKPVAEKTVVQEKTIVKATPAATPANTNDDSDLVLLDDVTPTAPKANPVVKPTATTTPAATAAPVTVATVPTPAANPVKPTAVVAKAPANLPTPPPEEQTSSGLFEEQVGTKPVAVTPRATSTAKPTINPVATGQFSLEKIKKKNSSLMSENIKTVFTEMKDHFQKTMILTLDDNESQLMAFAWDENFQSMKDTSVRFPLKTPSIFNIVATTQKPFHGYISLNEINEKFFEDWNQSTIPDHVTLVPILAGEKLVGMLMGFGEKSSYNKASLQLAEKLSLDLMKGFEAA